jgi:hypothetical protein
MIADLNSVGNKKQSIKDKFLLTRIEKTIKGQKKIEKHLADYLYTYRFCKMESDELKRIVKEAVAANEISKQDKRLSPEDMAKRI